MIPDSLITDSIAHVDSLPAEMERITSGIAGIPIPYSLQRDDVIAFILLGCFIILAYIMGKSKKFLWQQGKSYILHRERISLFVSTTNVNSRYSLGLIIAICLLTGIYFLNYFETTTPQLLLKASPHLLLAIYVMMCLAYLGVKWFLYSITGWSLFDKNIKSLWLQSYSILIYYFTYILFPLVLLSIYFNLIPSILVILGIAVLIFAKILMFYKWTKFFLANIYGIFPLILYFCALEIIPCLIMYKGIVIINNSLYTKL